MMVALVAALFACSPRLQDDANSNIVPGDVDTTPKDIVRREKFSRNEGIDLVKKSIQNTQYLYPKIDNATYTVFDVQIDFDLDICTMSREKLSEQDISLTLILKANIHNTDNKQSQMLLELRSNIQGAIVIGLYYADRTLYVNMLGKEYYAEEINLTNTLGMVGPLLDGIGIDVSRVVPGIVAGSTGVVIGDFALDGALGILTAFFDEQITATKYNVIEGSNPKNPEFQNIDYQFTLELAPILGLLSGFVGLYKFGTPNFDPLLKQLLGFDLNDFLTKQWPTGTKLGITVHTEKKNFTRINNQGQEQLVRDYVIRGSDLSVFSPADVDYMREKYEGMTPEDLPQTSKWEEEDLYPEYLPSDTSIGHGKDEAFKLRIGLSPLQIRQSNEKIDIKFTSYRIGASGKDTRYSQGSIGNVELAGTLAVAADAGSKITLNGILGDAFDLDLGALGDMPIKFPYQTRYEFTIDARVSLNLLHPERMMAELRLMFNQQPFAQIIVEKDVIYLDFSNMRTLTGQFLPNVKMRNFSINSFLSSIMPTLLPYIDPNAPKAEAAEAETAPSNAPANEGEETEKPPVDVMGLLGDILDAMTFPGRDKTKEKWIIELNLDGPKLSKILGRFLELNGNMALPNVHFEIDQKDPLNSIKLEVILGGIKGAGVNQFSKKAGIELTLDRINYFQRPTWQAYSLIDTEAKRNSFLDLTLGKTLDGRGYFTNGQFNVILTGAVALGMNQTTTGIDLSDLIGSFVENLMLSIGVVESKKVEIAYMLQGNIDLNNLSNLELYLELYNPARLDEKKYIGVFYEGASDTLYIDLKSFANLQDQIPGLAMIGSLPLVKYPNLGLRETLAGVNIADTIIGALYKEEGSSSPAANIATLAGLTVNATQANGGPMMVANLVKMLLADRAVQLIAQNSLGFIGNPSSEIVDLAARMLLSGAFENEGETDEGEASEEESGINILEVLGAALSEVEINSYRNTLTVLVASEFLSALVGIL